MSPARSSSAPSRILGTLAIVAFGVLLTGTFFQTSLSSRQLASNFVSPETWFTWATLGPSTASVRSDVDFVNLSLAPLILVSAIVSVFAWFGGAVWLVWRHSWKFSEALICWGFYGWIWWCLVDVWEWLWVLAGITGPASLIAILSVTPQFWLAACLAGWLTTWLTLSSLLKNNDGPPQKTKRHPNLKPGEVPVPRLQQADIPAGLSGPSPTSNRYLKNWLWVLCGIYVLVFTAMNWRLYFNLLVPHGDSVMYEEHLWNLIHGKGFRSYLDRGLFFGEHIQFVHLFLLPLYVLWPSHLMLELSSSTALALGAFPVFWMARRNTGSARLGFSAAVAYLLYFPMQFLDIEIDLKTFRPESFGIPLLLLTLDQLDRKRLVGTLIGIGLCLTVKEDYALIFGPLGLWIALSRIDRRSVLQKQTPSNSSVVVTHFADSFGNRSVFVGVSLSLFSVVYLWVATRLIMPWFRSGVEVHYASYFSRFGSTPEEILTTWMTRPGSVLEVLLTPETALYAIALLAPLAYLPLLAPGRLMVGFPLFAILCMNELEGSRTPQHQFHAPLVAIVFWSLADALPAAVSLAHWLVQRCRPGMTISKDQYSESVGSLVWTSSLATTVFFSLSPLGLSFWDQGSSWNWKTLYGPTQRAEMFQRIKEVIPVSTRVASTDFVHPRFTHHERSYDYSEYHREVSGEGNRIPDDTEYLVIDTNHKYSRIKRPIDIPELRDSPEDWEVIPDQTEGFFIILKRKHHDGRGTKSTP